ncbi:MAG: hypothetical protein NC321_13860 [Clostridium sp.]|nr:hypothetical protein [Clostridium sp.]
MKKSVIRIFSFLFILMLVLYYVNAVFSLKRGDGIYDLTKFYELEDDTVDVLVLGSSHAFESVNTGMLWNEYGTASFVLGGSYQQMWYTYHYLKEALKTQTPQLIILEAYMTVFDADYYPGTVVNTYGLKWSKNRIESIKAAVPQEDLSEYMFSYMQYHTRYTELSKEDFLKNQGNPLFENWKGFACNMKTAPFENPDISHITERSPLTEKTEKYYRGIIELAAEHNIPLLIVISPYAGITERAQAIFNTASDIASEYNVSFINYNLLYEEIGIDFTYDAADSNHLNYRGNQKFTHTLGEYISNNFNIPDRRGNDKYQSWEADSQYISALIKNQEFIESTDFLSIIDNINNQEYTLFISVDGHCNTSVPEMAALFDILKIPKDRGNELWYINNKTGILHTSYDKECNIDFRLDSHDVCMTRTLINEDTGEYKNSVIIDNEPYGKVTDGVNITVYNPITQSIVDSFGFDMQDNYNLVR